jgi:hypothetical protein
MKPYFLTKKIVSNVGILIAICLLTPHVSFAAPTGLTNFVSLLERLVTALFPIIVAGGFLAVGYNLIKYLSSKTSTDQDVYKAGILNSIFGLFIIFIVIGLIKILANSLGISALGVDIGIADNSGSGLGRVGSFRYIALSVVTFVSSRIVPILIACAMLLFFGNIVISMTKSDVEAERTKLNTYMRWGILALFLLLTLFSVVGMFTGSLFGTGAIIPQFQTK